MYLKSSFILCHFSKMIAQKIISGVSKSSSIQISCPYNRGRKSVKGMAILCEQDFLGKAGWEREQYNNVVHLYKLSWFLKKSCDCWPHLLKRIGFYSL